MPEGSWTLPRSVREKLHRARQLTDAFQQAFRRWSRQCTANIVPEASVSTPTEAFFHVELSTPANTIGWGVRLGEIMHDLRSALDQVAWSLDRDQDRSTTFPVFSKTREWKKWKADKAERFPDPVVEVFESVQPCQRKLPGADPLLLVHRLNQLDKHRDVPVVVVPPLQLRWILKVPPEVGHVDVETAPSSDAASQPRFVLKSEGRLLKPDFRATVTVGVALDLGFMGLQQSPAELGDLLRQTHREVGQLVDRVERAMV